MCRTQARTLLLPLILGGVPLVASQSAGEPDRDPAREDGERLAKAVRDIERRIEREMAEQDIVGLSIAVVDRDGPLWVAGYGWADREGRVPATADTVYRLGSLSKIVTGTAVMRLVEQGRIDLDAPISDILPEFARPGRFSEAPPITARGLLTHHAGLSSDLLAGADTLRPEPLERLVERLARSPEAQPPGAVFQYSNLGFAVLGRLVERVTGAQFADHAAAELFEPLEMARSSFVLDERVRPHLARGYIGGEECAQYPVREQPAGSLYSSAGDMGRFLSMVLGGGTAGGRRIIGADALEAMLSEQNAGVSRDLDVRVGLGWQLTNRFGPGLGRSRLAWHEGWLWHFSSFMAALPDHGLGVVVAANSDGARKSVTRIGLAALDRLVQAGSGRRLARWVPPAPPVTLPAAELARWVGEYDTSAGLVALEMEDGELQGTLSGSRVRLVPLENGTFAVRRLLYGFLPYQSEDVDGYVLEFVEVGGRTVIATVDRGVRIPFGERISPVSLPRAWRGRFGRWEAASGSRDFVGVSAVDLCEERGYLVARVTISGEYTPPMTVTLALAPASDDTAFAMGVGRFRGDMLRAVAGGPGPALEFQGYRLVREAARRPAVVRTARAAPRPGR